MEWSILLTNINKQVLCICLFVLLGILELKAQLEVTPSLGITWRSTAMNYFNFKGLTKYDLRIPYNYERNVQGFSLTPSIALSYNRIAFSYDVNLRYDYLHSNFDRLAINGLTETEDFITDHNINFLLKYRKISYGIGWGLVNFRKNFESYNGGQWYFYDLEFSTYNLLCAFPLKDQLHLQISAHYMPRGFLYNPYENYLMYSLKLYYRFDNLFKRKE